MFLTHVVSLSLFFYKIKFPIFITVYSFFIIIHFREDDWHSTTEPYQQGSQFILNSITSVAYHLVISDAPESLQAQQMFYSYSLSCPS